MNENIKDVTDSPRDWEDFWNSPEKFGTWEVMPEEEERIQELMKERPSNYIQDVLDGNHYIQKIQSPLSE